MTTDWNRVRESMRTNNIHISTNAMQEQLNNSTSQWVIDSPYFTGSEVTEEVANPKRLYSCVISAQKPDGRGGLRHYSKAILIVGSNDEVVGIGVRKAREEWLEGDNFVNHTCNPSLVSNSVIIGICKTLGIVIPGEKKEDESYKSSESCTTSAEAVRESG